MQGSSSSADRIYIYQRAFDFLLAEFQFCRPLLCKIRKQYDLAASNALNKKRELEIGAMNVYDAEENYNELITQMRKEKKHEFTELKQKSNEYIQQLIELRLDKSSLQKDVEALDKKYNDLFNMNKIQTETIADLSIKVQLFQDDISAIIKDSIECKKKHTALSDKYAETSSSAADLNKLYNNLLGELDKLVKEKEDKKREVEITEKELIDTENELLDLKRKISDTETDTTQALSKLRNMKQRQTAVEIKMRQMLREAGIADDSISVPELIEKLKNGKNSY